MLEIESVRSKNHAVQNLKKYLSTAGIYQRQGGGSTESLPNMTGAFNNLFYYLYQSAQFCEVCIV